MKNILKNLLRRKMRTVLTVGGIMIGVFALTVMGAMSEKLTQLVKGGEEYYNGKVIITDAQSSSFFGGAPLSITKRAEIEKVEGVTYVSPSIGMLLSADTGATFGTPQMIVSSDPDASQYESFKYRLADGRQIETADRGKVMLGSDLKKSLKAETGQTIELRGKSFEVIGILEPTLTAPDNTAIVSLADAQELVYETLPATFRETLKAEDIVSEFAVYLDDPSEAEEMATKIAAEVPDIKATGPSFFKKQVSQVITIFNLIILSGALIAIIVGGFSIMNTLTFAVIERTREIGIKKAVGARSSRILKEFLTEAAIIGVIGGIVGIIFGALTATAINIGSRSTGIVLFLVTPTLVIEVFIFAIVVSVVAGYLPARRASKLNPVEALRYE